MSSELSPSQDAIVEKLVAEGIFLDRRQALDHAVDLLREEAETVSEIREGLESIRRGEGRPLSEVVRELEKKYHIADDA